MLQLCHRADVLNKSRVSQHTVYVTFCFVFFNLRGTGHAPSIFATINVRNVRNAGVNVCVCLRKCVCVCVWLSVCQHIALTSQPSTPPSMKP